MAINGLSGRVSFAREVHLLAATMLRGPGCNEASLFSTPGHVGVLILLGSEVVRTSSPSGIRSRARFALSRYGRARARHGRAAGYVRRAGLNRIARQLALLA